MSDFACCAVAAEHRQPSWLAGLTAKYGEPVVVRSVRDGGRDRRTQYTWPPHPRMSVRIGEDWGDHYVIVTNGDRTADLGADKALADADISAVVALAGLCDDPARS